MTTYASQKGRAAPPAPAISKRHEQPLTPDQNAAIQANKDFCLENIPEIMKVLRELRESGLDVGWRNIKNCKLLNNP